MNSIYAFAESSGGTDDLDELFWRMADDIAAALSLEDCVLYLREGEMMVQKGAYGIKAQDHKVMEPIEIPVGSGIVGTCAATGLSQRVDDVSKFPGYIPDQFLGASELSVPVIFENRVIGVFDSEASRLGAYSDRDCELLQKFARIAAPRIVAALQQVKLEEFVVSLVEEREQLLGEELEASGRAPLPGQTVGPFRLHRLLGLTPDTTIWVADEKPLQRKVTLSILHKSGGAQSIPSGFFAQLQGGSRLHHPGIAEVYSSGSDEGWHWKSQEHIPNGQLLSSFLDSISRLPNLPEHYFELLVGIFRNVADSLLFAHSENVIHGSLRPEVLVLCPGSAPKILGFGQSVPQDDEDSRSSDAVALIQTLYHALAFREVGTDSYLSPSLIRPECPSWLDEVCQRVLNPEHDIPKLLEIHGMLVTNEAKSIEPRPRSVLRNWLARFSIS